MRVNGIEQKRISHYFKTLSKMCGTKYMLHTKDWEVTYIEMGQIEWVDSYRTLVVREIG